MRIIGTVTVFLLLNSVADSSLLDPVIENVRHLKATHPPDKVSGMWKKKMLWKARWVKEWKSSNVLKPIWRKFWGPVIIREWVPIPKPPPQWDPHSSTLGKDTNPLTSDAPFLNVGEPPAPNLGYLPKPSGSNGYHYDPPKQPFPTPNNGNGHASFINSGTGGSNYQIPHLPITSGHNSQAESYAGQSSYGSHVDSSAFDLNPPVESYSPHLDYSYKAPSAGTGHYPQSSGGFGQNTFHSHGAGHSVKATTPLTTGNHHHHHHHHHHHSTKPSSSHNQHHSHTADLTKFPPDWSSWKPLPPNLAQQASSAVSVVSKLQSTTVKPNGGVGEYATPPTSPVNNEFIQQASLVSEYHYTEPAPQIPPSIQPNDLTQAHPQNPVPTAAYSSAPVLPPTPVTNIPKNPSFTQFQNSPPTKHHTSVQSHNSHPPQSHKSTQTLPHTSSPVLPRTPTSTQLHKPTPTQPHNSAPTHSPTPVRPLKSTATQIRNPPPTNSNIQTHFHNPVPAHHRNPNPMSHQHLNKAASQIPTSIETQKHPTFKPNTPKDHKVSPNKTTKTLQDPNPPDFKALPSASVEAFHFIEAFPSNQTLTKASLIGNINQTGAHEPNQVSIVIPKSYGKGHVAKLAKAVVQEHMRNTKKIKASADVQSTSSTTVLSSTERTTEAIILPTTSSSIKKTLKAYLAEEANPDKVTKVFIVTPLPQKNVES